MAYGAAGKAVFHIGEAWMRQDIKRRRSLLASAAVVIVTLGALYLLGTALLPVGLSVVIAYVLLPVVRLLERLIPRRRQRPGLVRGIAVGIVYLIVLGILAGVLALVIPPAMEQSRQFAEEFPGLLNSARITVEGWIARYAELIPVEIRDRVEETLSSAGDIAGDAAGRVASQTWGAVSGSFTLILGLATAPVLVFYLIKDSANIRASLYAPFPETLRPCLKDLLDIAEKTLGGYIRGQLTLGLAVGAVVTVGLLLLGAPFPFILGLIAGLTELVPLIGPWIGGIAGVLVMLATAPHLVPWVILLYLGVQLLENALLVPRIQSDSLNLHPVALILVIIIASNYFGLWGVILGPPLAAMLKDMAVWFVREWRSAADALGAGDETGGEDPPQAGDANDS